MTLTCISLEEAKVMYRDAKDPELMIGILADLMLCTRREVRDALGIAPPAEKKYRCILDQKAAMELWAQGAIDSEIAKKCGVSRRCVTDWRRRRGLANNREPVVRDYMADYARGLSDPEIAAIHKVNRTTICQWRNHLGLPPNAKRGAGGHRKQRKEKGA